MTQVIKSLQLPFEFDAATMQQEVDSLSANWMLHYNKRDYEGEWSALPLRSANGSLRNVHADSPNEAFANTPLLDECPYIKSVMDTLQCEKRAVRLLKLRPGAVIKEHRDIELNFERGEARIHVPIMTNEDVLFYLNGERQVLNTGECWYMNFNLKHAITNNGVTDRTHLVMDCIANDWLRDLFDSCPPSAKSLISESSLFSDDARKEVISHLRSMNTPTSLQLADEMEKEG